MLKKILTAFLCLIVMSACGNGGNEALVSDGDDIIFTGKKVTFTKADMNRQIKKDDYASVILSQIFNKIGQDEGIDVDQLHTEAQSTIAEMEENGYADYMIYYYGSMENYLNNYISNSIIDQMARQKIDSDFEGYINNYHPYKAMMVSFTDEEIAKSLLEKVESGIDFPTACEEMGYSTVETLYTDTDTSLPLEVKDYVLNTDNLGISTIITTTKDTIDADGNSTKSPLYYVLNITSRNVEDFKDEFIDKLIQEYDTESLIAEKLKEHDINIYDQTTKDLLNSYYEVFD